MKQVKQKKKNGQSTSLGKSNKSLRDLPITKLTESERKELNEKFKKSVQNFKEMFEKKSQKFKIHYNNDYKSFWKHLYGQDLDE